MPNEVHRDPSGLVHVRASGGIYTDTPENFAADFGRRLPALPEGATEHIYTQGRRHCFMGDGNIIDGGPVPWPEGDAIIEAIGAGLAAQSARLSAAEGKVA